MIENNICTIYIIKNKINNKVYVGQTWTTLEKRWNNGHGYNRQKHMGAAIKCYGAENFYYEILDTCTTQEEANLLEIKFIIQYDSCNRELGYNLKSGGNNGKHSQETKDKLSQIKKGKPGRKQTLDIRNKISKKLKGKKLSAETKEKMSISKRGDKSVNYGKPLPQETRDKISREMTGENHPMYNKKHTSESKSKMQQNCCTRVLTTEDVLDIRQLHAAKQYTQKEIAAKYGVTSQTINDIIKRRSWRNI